MTASRIAELRRHALAPRSARSLLLTILGEYVLPHGGDVWSGTLVAALGSLGVEAKAARQAMARMALDGWLVRERVGRRVRWRIGPACEAMLREGAVRIYSFGGPRTDWNCEWVLVLTNVPESQRDLRHRLRARMAWAGFGTPGPGVWISPHHEREAEAARVLRELGLDGQSTSFVARAGELGDEAALVGQAWDVGELEEDYEAFIDRFGGGRPKRDAEWFVSHTMLVHEWRRFPFVDPGFPAELLPRDWIGYRARRLFGRLHDTGFPRAAAWFDARVPSTDPNV